MGSVVCADICGKFLRPSILIGGLESFLRGVAVTAPTSFLRSRGFRTTARRVFFFSAVLVAVFTTSAASFPTIPKEAIDSLGTVRGKPIRTGIVFVSGMMLEPPYVVKRIGTGIFIQDGHRKDYQVTGQVRNWKRFIATQGGVGAGEDEEDVDDFFDDEKPAPKSAPPPAVTPATAKTAETAQSAETTPAASVPAASESEAPAPAPVTEAAPAKPAPAEPVLAGSFKENSRSRMLLRHIDDVRRRFDQALRLGSGFFFSPSRRHLQLDARTTFTTLEALVEALKSAGDTAEMSRLLRSKGITFFGEEECREFLTYRRLLPQMDDRLDRMRMEAATRRVLSGASGVTR